MLFLYSFWFVLARLGCTTSLYTSCRRVLAVAQPSMWSPTLHRSLSWPFPVCSQPHSYPPRLPHYLTSPLFIISLLLSPRPVQPAPTDLRPPPPHHTPHCSFR